MQTRILVIEDNPADMELMRSLLHAHGYVVVPAVDGEAGMAAVRAEVFALVLCDILPPKMDGYEIARNMKRDSILSGIPLVAVTASALAGDADKMLKGGFDGYISKPIDPTKFVPQVEAFLDKKDWRTPVASSSTEDSSAADSQPLVPPLPRRGKVLIVDDSPVNAYLLRSTLERSGYEVLEARSGQEGLNLARGQIFDLILSDMHMPGLDGLEVARALRADPQLAAVPFIIISSSRMTERDRAEVLKAGADDYISRPLERKEILARVEAVLQKRRR